MGWVWAKGRKNHKNVWRKVRRRFLDINQQEIMRAYKEMKSLSLHRWRRMIGISGSLIWSKTLMELIFNPCGEFRWSPEGPVSQIHFPHLHVGVRGIFSDLVRSFQVLKREWGAESNGKLPHLFNPLQNSRLGSRVCGGRPAFARTAAYVPALWQNTLMMVMMVLDFENRKHTKFQFHWPISLRNINFLINFNLQISKCSMCIKFWNNHHQSDLPMVRSFTANSDPKAAVLLKAGLPPQLKN